MTLTGYATTSATSAGDVFWFCHMCNWSGAMPAGYVHNCGERYRPVGRFHGLPVYERTNKPIGSFATVNR